MVTYFEMQKKKEPVSNSQLPLLLVCSTRGDHTQLLTKYLSQHVGWIESLDHPDVHIINAPNEALSIDQVRKLQQVLTYRPYQADFSLIIIHRINAASIPAQNAMLKILEEPPAYVRLILLCDNQVAVLPTITSRCLIVSLTTDPIQAQEDQTVTFESISGLSYSQQIELAEKYSDREEAINLLDVLFISGEKHLLQQPQRTTTWLKTLLKTKQLLEQNVNVRLAMEECFFSLKKSL